jgi:hypothetical protein
MLRQENAFVKYMKENRRCIALANLQFDALDIACRQKVRELRQRRIEIVQPLFVRDELYAILVASGRKKEYQTIECHKIEALAEAEQEKVDKLEKEETAKAFEPVVLEDEDI